MRHLAMNNYNIRMKNNFISLEQVKIQLGQQIILSSANICIAQGQMVAIVGANGAGKTTLLKLLSGILQPSAGILTVDNCSYSVAKQALHLRKILGFAPDNPPLYAQDTVYRYLQFIAELKQVPKQELTVQINKVLDIFELQTYRNNYIYTLSKGIQQRINLAQAIIHNPQLLIMDEPINGLDTDQCDKFIDYLQLLRQQKITIIFASHNYTNLIQLSDYMLKIQQGNIEKILLPEPKVKMVQTYDHVNYTS